ncbi:hypothetical protein FRC15_004040 [Serendipita sp. 397]|nr:hypothetical protein FRC15_004040 [Serendipita sp. 397]
MDDQPMPIAWRIPPEIWSEIFDYAIVPEYLIKEVYEGNDWISYATGVARSDPIVEMVHAKMQRKSIRLVCKFWNQIVIAGRICLVHLIPKYAAEPIPEMVVKAWYAHSLNAHSIPMSLAGCEAMWRALQIKFAQIERLQQLRCPNLRRLDIFYQNIRFRPLYVDQLIETLKQFNDLTWFGSWSADSHSACLFRPDGGQRITLTNLQVVHCRSHGEFRFPYYRLDLPALRHLYLSACPREYFPLLELVESYGKTLHSLYFENRSTRGLIPSSELNFPGWESVPHLRELAICLPLRLRFDSLPLNHPLRVFAAVLLDVSQLSSWLESEHLEEIRLLHPDIVFFSGDIPISSTRAYDIQVLEKKARLKGINVRTCLCANEKDPKAGVMESMHV